MARLDRYMLSQLVLLFGFYGLVMVMLFWVNRAVLLFDQLIANGQNVVVFLEFSALILPTVIVLVIPIASFAAAVSVTNRLNSESELVVMQAAGFSPFRLARPVFLFGLFTALFLLVLTHILVPMSQQRLAEREADIAENVTARFVTEGRFVHPAEGITLYIRQISPEGELIDIFMSDERNPDQHFTYTAGKALILKAENGPRLVMFDGLVQVLNTQSQRLTTTGFEDFVYDISTLLTGREPGARKVSQIYTPELLNPTQATLKDTGLSANALRAEAHFRNAQAIYSAVTAMAGFAMLIVAGFSRFGLWRQVLLAIGVLALFQSLDNTMLDLARRQSGGYWIVYTASVIGILFNLITLFLATRPHGRDLRYRRKVQRDMARQMAQAQAGSAT